MYIVLDIQISGLGVTTARGFTCATNTFIAGAATDTRIAFVVRSRVLAFSGPCSTCPCRTGQPPRPTTEQTHVHAFGVRHRRKLRQPSRHRLYLPRAKPGARYLCLGYRALRPHQYCRKRKSGVFCGGGHCGLHFRFSWTSCETSRSPRYRLK